MQYWIMKSGLEIFDVARAYGIAALLSYADESEQPPHINDIGSAYLIEHEGKLSQSHLSKNLEWFALFQIPAGYDQLNPAWGQVFITDLAPAKKEKKVAQVMKVLANNFEGIIDKSKNETLLPIFGIGETLPGGLDPSAFKGLRGRTRSQYMEGQSKVDSENWALACLGAALCGYYIWQRGECFAIFPAPFRVSFNDYMTIREHTFGKRLQYLGVQNAAAHYSVILADELSKMAAGDPEYADCFSNLFYFSLFKTGNQWKPGAAGQLNLQPLLKLAIGEPDKAEAVFNVWDYLFRRGSVRGAEDLAVAITALIMHPTLTTFENHVRIFLRYQAKGVKWENLYTEESLKEVMKIVRVS